MENEVKKMIRAKVSNSLTFLKQDKGKWNIFYWNHSKMDFGFWSYILIEVDSKGKD